MESILHYFKDQKLVVLSGVLKDKDYDFIAKTLARVASHAVTVTPDNPRALSAEQYADTLGRYGVKAEPKGSMPEAIARARSLAREHRTAVISLGSLYTYSEVEAELGRSKASQVK